MQTGLLVQSPLEVADIFREHGYEFRLTHTLLPEQRRVMRAIEQCRTASLGGHVEQCDAYGHQRIAYNSYHNQTMRHHPYLHCVVPGGGLSVKGEGWRSCRRGFFLPVNMLARLFRRLCLQRLERAYEKGQLSFHGACAFLAKPTAFNRLLKSVQAREWWVYAKPPFGGPAQMLSYSAATPIVWRSQINGCCR